VAPGRGEDPKLLKPSYTYKDYITEMRDVVE